MHPTSLKNALANAVFSHRKEIQTWFDEKFKNAPAAFYCSVDLRDSGDKIAPVDCNLFPAGFNNICEVDLAEAPEIAKYQITKLSSGRGLPLPEKLMILAENHTENRFYLENLHHLKTILEEAGFEVRIGRLDGASATLDLTTASEKHLVQESIIIDGNGLTTASGFKPDWVILNNDFSSGFPAILDLVGIPIVPSYRLGWHSRKKSTHFKHYNALAKEFAETFKLDPWLIQIESAPVDHVDFNEGVGIDRVIETADQMLKNIESQYAHHGITRKPALFIKNDAGTYGMGIMVIQNVDELRTMNRRTKNKMSMGKNKSHIDGVLIQEGIPTTLTTDGVTAEPVVYMMGECLLGGFIRANKERSDMDNLNSQGMFFKKLCFKDLADSLTDGNRDELPTLEAVYGVVAKLSALAAAYELKEVKTK